MNNGKQILSVFLVIFIAAIGTFISVSAINNQTNILTRAFQFALSKPQLLPSPQPGMPVAPERETLQITEIGVISREIAVEDGSSLQSESGGSSSEGKTQNAMRNNAISISEEDMYLLDESDTDSYPCRPRPPCLDNPPYCMMPEPAEGWCDLTQPPKRKRKPISPNPFYFLLTSDGRRYRLINPPQVCKENCPVGLQEGRDLDSYAGETVLVVGKMIQYRLTRCTLSNPPECYPADPISWWPLPSGLDFEVEQLYPVEIQSKQEYSGKIISQQEVFPKHQVYQLITSDNPEGIFIRNSYEDLSIWKEWSGFAEIYQVVDKDLLLLNSVSPPVSVEPIPTTIPLMKVEGIVQTGSQISRPYCARGLYITADESNNRMGESQPLLLQKASGMFTDSSYIGKKVVVTGTTPGEVLCDALTCGCERYLLIKDIIITR